MRIGHGYDVHRFADATANDSGRAASASASIVLGGVHIPYERALEAHSDGDVLIHAICDAVLGALAMGDIGRHFPDTDPNNADVDSRILLRRVVTLANESGWALGNLDATVIAQAPRLAPYIVAMQDKLAQDFSAHIGQVNVKATTTETLGFAGRGEGIAAHAVVLLQAIT